MVIVAWSYYAYVVQLCIATVENVGEKIIYLLTYHLVFLMFVWAYWQTVFTKPMHPLKEFHLSYSDKELLDRPDRGESQQEILKRTSKDLPIYTRTMSGAIRFCDRCQLVKPDRCHHCSVCDKCVLKMDHHCPWVNNCVGFSNYKFFMLFLFYSLLYCVFITATDLWYFCLFWTPIDTYLDPRLEEEEIHMNRGLEYWNGLPDTQAKFHIMFLFFAASMFSVSLASLLAYHLWLVCKNRSTLEAFRAPAFRHGTDKNGFSLGVSKNFRQVFGDELKYWPIPIFSSLGDGCSFPTCLVNQDSEQAATSTGHGSPPGKGAGGEAHKFPPKPLRDSQSRLLTGTPSWTEADSAEEKERRGTPNPGMSVENET